MCASWETVFYVSSQVAPADAVLIAIFVSLEGTLVGLIKKLIKDAEERGQKKEQQKIVRELSERGDTKTAQRIQDLIERRDERRPGITRNTKCS